MLPVIALVGRPNVGKSTLFNRLTKTRDALVAGVPGLTRDRQFGKAQLDGRSFWLIDTGGLSGEEQGIDEHMAAQMSMELLQEWLKEETQRSIQALSMNTDTGSSGS